MKDIFLLRKSAKQIHSKYNLAKKTDPLIIYV